MTVMQQWATAQASPEVVVNENFESLEHVAVYAKNPATTTGLIWGYLGGRWSGIAVTSGTLTLTASNTNYVVVKRADGVISTATTTTNWNDAATYARVFKITTGASTVTAVEDHRAGSGGVHGQAPATGASTSSVNVFSKNQSVSSSTLTSGTTIAVDASLSNNFRLVLATNATLSNPTSATDGMVLNIRIKQDATGSRTLAYGSAFKWPGGTVPALSTAANAVDLLSMYYDGTDAVWSCVLQKGFA